MNAFVKAVRSQAKLRILFEGFSGSGKTYSSLVLAKGLGGKIAFIDTERGKASLYSEEFDFDTMILKPPFSPERYIEAINDAEEAGYDTIIIDSLSHEWGHEGGALDIQTKAGGRFTDWAKVTPRHNRFIDAIVQSPCDIIATCRTKADYVQGDNNGKKSIARVGTKAEQREGMDFEFTTVLRLNKDNAFEVHTDRTHIFKAMEGSLISDLHANKLKEWSDGGESEDGTLARYGKIFDSITNIVDLRAELIKAQTAYPSIKPALQELCVKRNYDLKVKEEEAKKEKLEGKVVDDNGVVIGAVV